MADEIRLVAMSDTFRRGLKSMLPEDDPGRAELDAAFGAGITEEEARTIADYIDGEDVREYASTPRIFRLVRAKLRATFKDA